MGDTEQIGGDNADLGSINPRRNPAGFEGYFCKYTKRKTKKKKLKIKVKPHIQTIITNFLVHDNI